MGNLFGKNQMVAEESPREKLERRYNSARADLLLVVVFTVINTVLLLFKSDTYFLFSAFVPYFAVTTGMYLCGKLPEEYYVDITEEFEFLNTSFLWVTLIFAAIIVVLYFLSWIFSKKFKVGFLIFAAILFVIDTVLMLFLSGISIDNAIDILIHIWFMAAIISGISAAFKLKKLPEEEIIEDGVSEIPENTDETPENITTEDSQNQ